MCFIDPHAWHQQLSRSRRVAEEHVTGGALLPDLETPCSRRSAVTGASAPKSSISGPSNIAEGFGRHFRPTYINHLWIANGSNNELQTQLELGRRIEVITEADAEALIGNAEEVGRMLRGLVASLDRVAHKER